jgi:hypothetical protein
MIKELPGWANYMILWGVYSGLAIFLDFLFVKAKKKQQIDWLFDVFVAAVFCGAYLAKWRFYGERPHFW